MRKYVLDLARSGANLSWRGYWSRIEAHFVPAVPRQTALTTWNEVSNQLQWDQVLVSDPTVQDGPLLPPSALPHVRIVSDAEAQRAVRNLAADPVSWGKGKFAWQVAMCIPGIAYVCTLKALRDLNGIAVHTRSLYWYPGPLPQRS